MFLKYLNNIIYLFGTYMCLFFLNMKWCMQGIFPHYLQLTLDETWY